MEVVLHHIKDFAHSTQGLDKFYDVGILANFIPFDGAYVGAVRSGNGSIHDTIEILNFDIDYNIINKRPVIKGEDPRCFLYNEIPYALCWHPLTHKNGLWCYNYNIINLNDGSVIGLGSGEYGKNWMPLVDNGELYFVITIDPEVSIMYCDIDSGTCSWEKEFSGGSGIGESAVTKNRGGTPFIYSEEYDIYFGLGHVTYDSRPPKHLPYLYTLSPDFDEVFVGPDLKTKFEGVNDPLSIFKENDKYYTCIGFAPKWMGDTPYAKSSVYEVELI